MTADDIRRERIDAEPDGDWDEDGFHLRFTTDEGEYDLRVTDVPTARSLVEAVDKLRDWVTEHDRELAAYRRATPEEREAVLYRFPAERALDLREVDPEMLREAADHYRKADKEQT